MINTRCMFGYGDGRCTSPLDGLGSIFDTITEFVGGAVKSAGSVVTGAGGGFPDAQTQNAYNAGIAAGGTPVLVPELGRKVAQRPPGSQQPGQVMPPPDINADEYTRIVRMMGQTKVSPIAAALVNYYNYYQANSGIKPAEQKGGIFSSIFGGKKDAQADAGAQAPAPEPEPQKGGIGTGTVLLGLGAVAALAYFATKR